MDSNQKKSVDRMDSEDFLNVILELSAELFHDFKNNLATISGISQLTMYLGVSDEVKENMEVITKAALEGKDQINRFYRIVKGYDTDVYRYETLSKIVLDCLELIDYKINKSGDEGIKLNVNIHSTNKIYCNEYKMRQAILNILMNAIDAMEETGGILEVNLFDISDKIVLEIIDTGIGISEEDLEKIYEANYTTKGAKGTGLGLRITKNAIEECGGIIKVKSKFGKGTIFSIFLPVGIVER